MSEDLIDDHDSIDFGTMIEVDEPHDSFSWLQGFLTACKVFGIWDSGEQRLGSGKWTVRKIREEINRYKKEHFYSE